MKTSVVNSSKIDLDDRFDAEYFEPSYLDNENRLKKLGAKPLSDYCRLVSSAFYPSATELYATGEMPFIRCVDCINFPTITSLQNDTFERLPLPFIKENKTIKVLKNEDIVITKVGSPCYASIIYGLEEVALSRTVLGIYKIKNIDPFYLTVFLRSKYGFEQLIRERELTIQYQLTLERVGRILAYKPKNENTEKLFRNLFIKSQQLNQEAVEEYKKAEAMLLDELGLLNWKPKHRLSFVNNFSDTQSSVRIDAEYFQPKFNEIKKIIFKKGFENLEANFDIIRNNGLEYFSDGVIGVVKTKQLNGKFIDFNVEDNTRLEFNNPLIEDRDVIFASMGVGSLGKANILYHFEMDNKQFTVDSTLKIFRQKKNANISPELLVTFLQSIPCQELIYQNIVGSSGIISIYEDYIKKLPIPIIKSEVETQVVVKVKESHLKNQQSRMLLEIAKKGVEMAIEKDEAIAEQWIKAEIKKLGVEISV